MNHSRPQALVPTLSSRAVLVALFCAACGAPSGGNDGSDPNGSNSDPNVGSPSAGNASELTPPTITTPIKNEGSAGEGNLLMDDPSEPVTTPEMSDTECGAESYSAEPKTLEMYILFDDSGSWSPENWQLVKDAVEGFITDEASDGLGVALSFFGDECRADRFETPEVAMDVLPANRAELQAALQSKRTDGETVTEPALIGGIEFARARLASGINSRITMLLVTDGEPDESDCRNDDDMANDIPAVAAAAEAGFNGAVSIPTYVLAVAGGAELTESLHSIALAGGTNEAVNADPTALAEVFNQIRNAELESLPCEYDLPPAYEQIGSPDKVNVTFGGTTLTRVNGEAECGEAVDGGWYYDNPAAPTRIIACSTTCEAFKIAPLEQTVDIALGCPTRVPEIK